MNKDIGLKSILDDLDHYADTYKTAFYPNSSDVDVIQAFLRHDLDKEVIEKISQSFSSDQEVNVMGVGTGDGTMDLIITDNFRQNFGKLRYTVIEPGSIIEQFKNKVYSNNEMKGVVFDWKNSTLAEVCRDASNYEGKFVFISAIHSAYYFDHFEDSISHLFNYLAVGGALMFIVNTDDNTLIRFLNGLGWKKNLQAGFTEQISRFAEAVGSPILTFDLPAKINVTSCFDENSEEGGKLLDFLTEIAYFRETASSDIKEEAMSLMKSFASEGNDRKLYFETNCKAMVIIKRHARIADV